MNSTAAVRKIKQPNEISKFGTLPGSMHCQLDFPITEKVIDHGSIQRPIVKQSIAHVQRFKEADILKKHKQPWNQCQIPGDRPAGITRFPYPAMKRENSKFQSIPEYEYNFRADYVAKFNGPVKTKDSRRGMAHHCDLRDESRLLFDQDLEWKNDRGETMHGMVNAQSRKKGEHPSSLKDYDKSMWNLSTEYDTKARAAIDDEKRSEALKHCGKKNEMVASTRMGLIGRHNMVAQRIREEKTLARAEPKAPPPPTPTRAAMARTERQTKKYEHSGVYEYNTQEGCHMWSDTGSCDQGGRGDTVKVQTDGRWSFAAPN